LPNGAPNCPALIGNARETDKNAQNLNQIMSHAANSDHIANDTRFIIFLRYHIVAEIYNLSFSSTFLYLSFIHEFEMQKKCQTGREEEKDCEI
jgi:hypothetical protein